MEFFSRRIIGGNVGEKERLVETISLSLSLSIQAQKKSVIFRSRMSEWTRSIRPKVHPLCAKVKFHWPQKKKKRERERKKKLRFWKTVNLIKPRLTEQRSFSARRRRRRRSEF